MGGNKVMEETDFGHPKINQFDHTALRLLSREFIEEREKRRGTKFSGNSALYPSSINIKL